MGRRLRLVLFVALCFSGALGWMPNTTRVVVTFASPGESLSARGLLEPNGTAVVDGELFVLVKQYGRRVVMDLGRVADPRVDFALILAWFEQSNHSAVGVESDGLVGHSQIVSGEIENATLQSASLQNASAVGWHFLDSEPYSLQMEEVWSALASYPPTGDESRIPLAMLDGGLAGLVQGPTYFESLLQGYDFISDPSLSLDGDGRDSDPTDPGDAGPGCPVGSWHGTKMAAAACLLHGVVPGVQSMLPKNVMALLPVRVLGQCGTGYANDVADAIVWAAGGRINGLEDNTRPALVISMSFSGFGVCPSFLQSAVNFATSSGIVLVAAAGNKGGDVSDYFPANCQGVIAVGSSTRQGTLADYSNSGVGLAVLAAGGDAFNPIVTVFVDNTRLVPSLSMGTSFSAAFTSSLVALKEFIAMNQGNISASNLIFLLNKYAGCIATINSVGPYIPPNSNGVMEIESGGRFWVDQLTFLKFIIYLLQYETVHHNDNLEVYIPANYSSNYVVGATNPSGCSNMSSLSVLRRSNLQNWARSCGTQGKSPCSVTSPFIWTGGPNTNPLDFGGNSGIYLNDGNIYSFLENNAAWEVNVYYRIDLGQPRLVLSGAVWNRYGLCSSGAPYNWGYTPSYCYDRLSKFRLYIGNDSITPLNNILCFTEPENRASSLFNSAGSFRLLFDCSAAITGRYAYMYHPGSGYFSIGEFEVYGPLCCEQGAYSNGTQCSYCPLGTYGTSPGMTNSATCTQCAVGTYSTGSGFSSCTLCAAGRYSTGSGMTSSVTCLSCIPGTYSTGLGMSSSAACLLCVAGTYSTGSGMPSAAACSSCFSGTYSSRSGSTTCTSCQVGAYSTGFGATSCTLCPAGTSSVVQSSAFLENCNQCYSGTYGTGLGMTSNADCTKCSAGTYSTAWGAIDSSTCQLCSPGRYSIAGTSNCFWCPAGKYLTSSGIGTTVNIGATPCTGCQAGTYGTVSGAPNSSGCNACAAGTFSISGVTLCWQCYPGSYLTGSGTPVIDYMYPCLICQAGSYGTGYGETSSSVCILCNAGTFSNVTMATSSLTCSQCAPGSYATGSGMTDAISACIGCQAGSYGTSTGASDVSACSLCQAGTYSGGSGYSACQQCVGCTPCLAGSTSDPTVCGCQSGFYGTPLTGCTQCPPNTNSPPGSVNALGCRCLAGYVCTYTKVLRISLFMNFNNTPAPTTADALLNSALMASVAQAAGVPVGNIQVVSITPTPQGGRRSGETESTYEVVCLLSGVSEARHGNLRRAGASLWQGEAYSVEARRKTPISI